MLTEYKKVRTPSVHTGHTDLQADLIRASRHGVSTGCALGGDSGKSSLKLTRGTELKPWMEEGRPDASPGRTPHPLGSSPPASLWLLLQALVMDLSLF